MDGSFLMVIDNAVQRSVRQVRFGAAGINVTEWGEGPPVLLLHGNPDSGMMWDGVASRLGTHFRCIAPDLPSFGHSEVPNGYDRSLEGMAHFVEQFLGAAEIKRPIDVVAHDFGGPFGFAWAIRHSDSVRRIVAINTLFFSDYHWHFWARVCARRGARGVRRRNYAVPLCKLMTMGIGMIEWFDDLALGMRFKTANKLVTREDIIRFASEFDPQPYHLDEAAAQRTALQGLAASGWHTAAIAMRLAVELRPFGPHPLLGLGVDDLRLACPRPTRRYAPP